jgi:hypothetical protein
LVEALVDAVTTTPANDDAALRSAFTSVLTESKPALPTGRRTPDRSLVQGPGGERATDAEIESGDFQVVAVIEGEKWFVVLDIEGADIILMEKEA